MKIETFILSCILSVTSINMLACGTETKDENIKVDQKMSIAAELMPLKAVVGIHMLMIVLKDADDMAVEGATITVDPQMPAHGHGSDKTPVITETGEGKYKAEMVSFTMPGEWVVTVKATKGDYKVSKEFRYQVVAAENSETNEHGGH